MGPTTLTDQLRGCALMGAGEHPGELGRLREDRSAASMNPARSDGTSEPGGELALW
jgi:hypothetical protein